MLPVQAVAQSGGRRITASVKILAGFLLRQIDPAVINFSQVKHNLSINGLVDAHFLPGKTYIRPQRMSRLEAE
jgi:hypothetical protein